MQQSENVTGIADAVETAVADKVPAFDDSYFDAMSAAAPKPPKKWVRPVIIAAIAAVVIAAGLTVYFMFFAPKAVAEVTLKQYTVSSGDIRVDVAVDGTVSKPFQFFDYDISGTLTAVNVKAGDTFKTGDVLAELDPEPFQDAIEKAEADLRRAELSLKSAQIQQDQSVKSTSESRSNLQLQIATQQKTIDQLNETIRQLGDDITVQSGTVSLSARADSLNYSIAKLKSELADLEAPCDANARADSANYQIYKLESELADMNAFPDDYSGDDFAAKAADISAQRQKLATDIETKKNDIAKQELELSTSLTSKKNDLSQQQKSLEIEKQKLAQYQTQLAQSEVTPSTSIETAQLSLADAQKALDKAKEDAENASLVATCDGTVANVSKKAGESVAAVQTPSSSNSFITYIAADTKLEATAAVPELDIGEIKTGQKAEMTIDAWSDEPVTGVVTSISDIAANNNNGVVSYKVTVTLDTSASGIRDQMNGTISFIKHEVKGVLKVDNGGIYAENGKQYADVITPDGGTDKREVTTGFSDGSECEIVSGLREGDVIRQHMTPEQLAAAQKKLLDSANSASNGSGAGSQTQRAAGAMPAGGGMVVIQGGGPSMGGGGPR